MRSLLPAQAAAILAAVSGVSAKTMSDLCQGSTVLDGGNYYCRSVDKVQYTNIKASGSYSDVVGVADGTCNFAEKSFSQTGGQLAMQLSLHLRGPIQIKQMGVYYPDTATKAKRSAHLHGHQRFHQRRKESHPVEEVEPEKRAVGDVVVATIDGKVVSWLNNWDGSKAVEPTAAPKAPEAPKAPAAVGAAGAPVAAAVAKPTPAAAAPSLSLKDGEWGRQGYFKPGAQPTGLSFLRQNGQWPKQGDADEFLGAKLGEVAFDGKLVSNEEVMIYGSADCDSSCGYTRPGAVNKLGFGGARKLFAFQFTMVSDGHTGTTGSDMPAIWSLNAKISRLQQYGKCSCWPQCGELDFFETLAPGDQRCKSTFHTGGDASGGDSNYFPRPSDANTPVTGVVLIYDTVATVAYVKDFPWNETLSPATIQSILDVDSESLVQSSFALSS